MNFPTKSIAAFALMLGGMMAAGSIYSAGLNTIGTPISIGGIIFLVLTLVYAYIGFYCYNYLAYGKGNVKVAFGAALLLAILGVIVVIGGPSPEQRTFALHEIINYVAPWFIVFALFPDLRK